MRELTILADDLTGALDSGAAFATPDAPVEIAWHGANEPRCAFDTETRALDAEAARRTVSAWLPELADSRLALKKLDSLLRGNSFAELAVCCRDRAFDAVYVAPAFPAQGRLTEGGRLVVAAAASAGRDAPALSISEALAAEGIKAVVVPAGAAPPPRGVAVCDAATEADLQWLVQAGRSHDGHVLWCGSAGLARALAGSRGESVASPAELVIVGSRHPVSCGHVARLSEGLGEDCVRLRAPDGVAAAIAAVASALRLHRQAALVFELPPLAAAEAETIYLKGFAGLRDAIAPPAGVIVVGGDTLFRLLKALGATSLAALGERAPGIAVSHIDGGAWHGTVVTSKSGAFSDAGMFTDFIHRKPARA